MMGELDQRLVALGAALDLPPAPDVVPAVLGRLPERHVRRGRPARRSLALALTAALLLAGAAVAVPSTRHAILRFLGLRGVSIERVPRLPPLPAGARLGLGERIPLEHARHAAGFTALLPTQPAAAYLGRDVPGGRISLVIGPVLVIEFRGTVDPFIFKLIGFGTHATRVRVNGGAGAYLFGAPHEVIFQALTGETQTDRIRLAGNVLLWDQGPLTLRVEGTHTLDQALRLARSLR